MHLHLINLLHLFFTINLALSISLSGTDVWPSPAYYSCWGHRFLTLTPVTWQTWGWTSGNFAVTPFLFWCGVRLFGLRFHIIVSHFREIVTGIPAASLTTSIVKTKEIIYISLLLSGTFLLSYSLGFPALGNGWISKHQLTRQFPTGITEAKLVYITPH